MNKNFKKIIIIVFIAIFILLTTKFISNDLDIYSIKKYISSFGILAPIIYIIMFALVPLTFFPDSVLAIASGLVFGFYKGYIYTTIGALIGGSLAFFIARYLGYDLVKKISNEKLSNIDKLINENGFYIIFLLRLIPLFPFDVISYGAGLTNVKYKHFLGATLFGTIPGIAVFTNIGAKSVNISSTGFYTSIAMLILLFIISIILKNKILNNKLKEID
jgi:uncharacterized membrane protein YdjX (TVP38/TMEM64 family)